MNNKRPISALYTDLLRVSDDPDLLHLVEDLDTLYTPHHLPSHLERSMEANQFADDLQAQLLTILPEQPGTLSSIVPHRPERWSHLNTAVAVLFTVLLIGALLGTFALVRSNRPAAHNSTAICEASPQALFTPPLSIGSIRMMSVAEGWG